ncbi:hypothetical protein HOE425_70057 [Hoeflea sp. EC-HK425]|jgi:hypothetical protein|nr:hypothetical protein HOE425_70057 [Hoeflea sp. EC-HK425]
MPDSTPYFRHRFDIHRYGSFIRAEVASGVSVQGIRGIEASFIEQALVQALRGFLVISG